MGELVFGVVVGNLYLTGYTGLDYIKSDQSVQILADIGIVLMLFKVGLESEFDKMKEVGLSSLLVATFGVITSLALGWLISTLFLPDASIYAHAFTAIMICSTSIGIGARVFMDFGRIQTPEARTVLGAAVIDDSMGLILLAMIVPIIAATSGGAGEPAALNVIVTVIKAIAFLVGSIMITKLVALKVFHLAARFRSTDLLLSTALGTCFGLAYTANLIGLAPIIGAFAAGLGLEELHWRPFTDRGEQSVLELIKPLVGFLAPVFFFLIGTRVDMLTFTNPSVLGFAAALTLAAILGKLTCGMGVLQKGISRLSVSIGMIPRGEVILIAAGIGSQLKIGGQPVVGSSTFSSVVILVILTTMITPPLLKWSIARREKAAPEF
jgi:Kef-type K+ transport system membrane component KefB